MASTSSEEPSPVISSMSFILNSDATTTDADSTPSTSSTGPSSIADSTPTSATSAPSSILCSSTVDNASSSSLYNCTATMMYAHYIATLATTSKDALAFPPPDTKSTQVPPSTTVTTSSKSSPYNDLPTIGPPSTISSSSPKTLPIITFSPPSPALVPSSTEATRSSDSSISQLIQCPTITAASSSSSSAPPFKLAPSSIVEFSSSPSTSSTTIATPCSACSGASTSSTTSSSPTHFTGPFSAPPDCRQLSRPSNDPVDCPCQRCVWQFAIKRKKWKDEIVRTRVTEFVAILGHIPICQAGPACRLDKCPTAIATIQHMTQCHWISGKCPENFLCNWCSSLIRHWTKCSLESCQCDWITPVAFKEELVATSSIRESLLQQMQSVDDFNLTNCMKGIVHALNCMKFDDDSKYCKYENCYSWIKMVTHARTCFSSDCDEWCSPVQIILKHITDCEESDCNWCKHAKAEVHTEDSVDTETRNVLEFVLLHNEGLPRLRHDSNDRRGPSRTLSRRIAKAHKLHRELKGKLRASVRHVAARGV
ncbi:hypothetical protein PRIPAC_92178 [Pristionchus pacificus]|uniref:Uncharacterized protein n=1 Tax=Pristionchus pacificus TaxID=54126 RepID=A0A2A6CHD4_PRIPA|nr:hypothetical protein PRIPAC_92178 [Pristionchus pacificus]|eukprot:PDM77506.1 hypothetical protein PRIPAC_34373 [Pristionchus pacificus]